MTTYNLSSAGAANLRALLQAEYRALADREVAVAVQNHAPTAQETAEKISISIMDVIEREQRINRDDLITCVRQILNDCPS